MKSPESGYGRMEITAMRNFLLVSGALCCFTAGPAGAEVVTDGSMGTAGSVGGPTYAITGNLGRQVGNNLFHSFPRFNIARGEQAVFSGPATVTNIISRVTGGTASTIDGTISSDIAGANLYYQPRRHRVWSRSLA